MNDNILHPITLLGLPSKNFSRLVNYSFSEGVMWSRLIDSCLIPMKELVRFNQFADTVAVHQWFNLIRLTVDKDRTWRPLADRAFSENWKMIDLSTQVFLHKAVIAYTMLFCAHFERCLPDLDTCPTYIYGYDLTHFLFIINLNVETDYLSRGFGVLGFWGFGVWGLGFRV